MAAFVPTTPSSERFRKAGRSPWRRPRLSNGLTLRSPGRFLAATKRLDLLRRQQPVDPARDLRCLDAALKAEAYRVFTEAAVHNMERGQDLGSRSSLMKVYWSELDIELNETALSFWVMTQPSSMTGAKRISLAWLGRSTPGPTRSNAKSSPSACSAYRGADRWVTP